MSSVADPSRSSQLRHRTPRHPAPGNPAV